MNEKKYGDFVLSFFEKIGCSVTPQGNGFTIDKIPRAFSDLSGVEGPYNICFDNQIDSFELVFPGSVIGRAISRFLDESGKTTLLKIDFDIDVSKELENQILFKNAEIVKIEKKERNSFFSRFSFLSTFRYFNKVEQILNEIYVHEGKIVNGDLSGYNVIPGDVVKPNLDFLKEDFSLAKENLKEITNPKMEELRKMVGDRLDKEIKRINEHYDKQLLELSGDLNNRLNRIKELELTMRSSEGAEKEELKEKIDRLRKSLVKTASDDARERILKEKEFSIRDSREKFSLDIKNKVLNTTVIYYPVFVFSLYLKNDEVSRMFDVVYDPLTKSFDGFVCEECKTSLSSALLCSNGHVVCSKCISSCGDCGGSYCLSCLAKECSVCSRKICRNCLRVCRACSKTVCRTHLRIDCVSGEERCINCLRACSRCHGLSQDKFFGISEDGSKVCLRCLGEEKRKNVFKEVFR